MTSHQEQAEQLAQDVFTLGTQCGSGHIAVFDSLRLTTLLRAALDAAARTVWLELANMDELPGYDGCGMVDQDMLKDWCRARAASLGEQTRTTD